MHPDCTDMMSLVFADEVVRALPGDPSRRNVPRQVPGAAYSHVDPTPVPAPRLLAWSDDVGAMLGICRPAGADHPAAQVLAGNVLLSGMQPYAARYGGHQFGHWAGQLGDGRAITLGELRRSPTEVYELQLKGAGPTPYSRRADGRAVLRSSVREFLCSEAMHFLGVPTTRALSLVTTGDSVIRDMFYDGRPEAESGAIVCRVAPSFLRFGNFEIHAALGETDLLRQLTDHVIARHFPELGPPSPDTYVAFFTEVCRRTAVLAAHWMRVGFVHGVLNTDNMSVLGVTIDYGPYGWLEGYDPRWTPNTTDAQGRRYGYGNQPFIAFWNLARFGEALSPLVETPDVLGPGLEVFRETYNTTYEQMVADKLGLRRVSLDGTDAVVTGLFDLLEATETDMTLFFRGLARVPLDGPPRAAATDAWLAPLAPAFYSADALAGDGRDRLVSWLGQYAERVRTEARPATERLTRMDATNPKYVLRNYMAQVAIDAAAEGDPSVIERLLHVLRRPYDEQPEHEDLAQRRPEWARQRAGCSMLSCSS